MSKLILIDGNSLLHRAYHALPPLSTPDGRASGAVYGFTSMLLKVIEELEPTHIAVAWDTGKPTFRHQEYAAYKEHRPKMPEDLFDQLEMAKKVVEAFNIPQFAVEGYEADDVVGSLAREAGRWKLEARQEVGSSKLEQAERPNQDPSSLQSQASTPASSVQHPASSLKTVIVTGDLDLLQLVDEHVEVYTSRKGFSDTVIYDVDAVKERYDGLTPDQIVDYKALKGDASDNIPGVKGVGDKTATRLLNKYSDLEGVYQHIDQISGSVRQKLIDEQEQAFLSQKLAQIDTDVPIRLDLTAMKVADYDPRGVVQLFQELGFRSLVDRMPESENAVGEQESIFAEQPSELNGRGDPAPTGSFDPDKFDLQIAAHLLTGKTGKRLRLENLAFTYLGESLQVDDLDPKGLEGLQQQLKVRLEQGLDEKENAAIKKLFYDVEMPLKPILREMEEAGVLVDLKLLKSLSESYDGKITKVEQQVYTDVGHEFNLNSPKQLEEVLFDQLGLPVIKRTKTQRSTDESVLNKLLSMHPAVENILKYRKLAKIKSTYLDPLPELLDEEGRVHTTFNQTATASGRLSSENPNLQNIPKGDTDNLRRLFIAPTGKVLLVADYSQIELRILAHLSGDEHLIDAFEHNQDIHLATGARVFDKTIDQVTPKERDVGKTINFALMYGMSEFGLAEQLNIDKARAKLYIESYFENYPQVRQWQEKHLAEAREKGFVKSMFGRRRYLPGLKSSNFHQRSAAERIAINHPMQASQADIIKKAMGSIHTQLTRPTGPTAKMLLQVHDELVFEVGENGVEDVATMVKNEMESVVELTVPIIADVSVGPNWAEMKKLHLPIE